MTSTDGIENFESEMKITENSNIIRISEILFRMNGSEESRKSHKVTVPKVRETI